MKLLLCCVQVVFVATAAYDYVYWGDLSDIAIDDISFGSIPPPGKYGTFEKVVILQIQHGTVKIA